MSHTANPPPRSASFHLLEPIPYEGWLALQRRLAFAAQTSPRPHVVVVLCEHPAVLTIGRSGSRRHVRWASDELQRREIPLRWVERGGGCILHSLGQLAIYPIAHLGRLGLSLGQWTRLLRAALLSAMADLKIAVRPREGHCGLVGRSGQLATAGFAVRGDVCRFGAYVNVNPPLAPYRRIDVVAPESAGKDEHTTMGSLMSELGRRVTIAHVQSALVTHLADALGCGQRYEVSDRRPRPPRFA